MKKIPYIFFITLFLITITIHSYGGQRVLTIAAASDLTFALKEIAMSFEKKRGIKVILSFGSTGKLTQQIKHGAPFDLFFAANESYIRDLEKRDLIIQDTKRLYAQGRIVLAVNKETGLNIKKPSDLLNPLIKRIAIANPDHAPYGMAAREALISSNLWEKIRDRLVYGENIRQTLQFIQTGNAQAGIVALSVASVPEIRYTFIDSSLHKPINQMVAVIKGSGMVNEAMSFIGYVNSTRGRTIMKRYGFLLPEEF